MVSTVKWLNGCSTLEMVHSELKNTDMERQKSCTSPTLEVNTTPLNLMDGAQRKKKSLMLDSIALITSELLRRSKMMEFTP